MTYQKFIDKSSEENYSNGIEYQAVGLVTACHMVNGVSNDSGKDYTVEYIDPFGYLHCEFRRHDKIEISPINEEHYQHLKRCYGLYDGMEFLLHEHRKGSENIARIATANQQKTPDKKSGVLEIRGPWLLIVGFSVVLSSSLLWVMLVSHISSH